MIPVPSRRLIYWGIGGGAAALAVVVFPGAWLVLLAFDLLLAGAAALDWLLTPAPAVWEVTRLAAERMPVLGGQTVVLVVRNRAAVALWLRVRDGVPATFQREMEELAGWVPAHGEVLWQYQIVPRSRGQFAWEPIQVRYRSVLGLWERRRAVSCRGESRVYPNVSALQRYHLLAHANRLGAMGIRKVRLRGGSWEFESLRDYSHGDDVRLIDWKATARRRKPIIRNHEAERNQTVLILVDCGRLMNAEVDGVAKLDHAVNTTLLLAHVALSRGDRVGLCTFSHKVHAWLPPRPHVGQNRLITETLYNLRGDYTETDHGRCLRLVKARHPKRALLVLLTDFVDATTAKDMVAHLQLASRHHLVLFVALKDPFIDQAARSRPVQALDAYRKAAAIELLHDRREVLERLRQLGAQVLDADPSDVNPPLINRYLEITYRGLL
jgi:uncharacterized protein (DUF58 family)